MYTYDINGEKEYKKAYSNAIKLLSFRDHSEKEITDKLYRRKYNKRIINKVVVELVKKGYIDNEQFAEKWINQIAYPKRFGLNKIRYELFKRGISYEIISEKLNNYDEYKSALKATKKKITQLEQRKLKNDEIKPIVGRFLQRRGFTYETIIKALEKYDMWV